MAQAFLHGGGGDNPLNFKVVGGTSAPSNPKTNTIWVNTSTAITGYVFSAAQPTGSAGLVWILTGKNGTIEFNALKKNSIQINPLSAKQYVSGAWVDVTAKIYQGGAWADWWVWDETTLFADGDEATLITGGWASHAYKVVSSYTGVSTATVTNNGTNLNVSFASGTSQSTLIGTNNFIDLTDYKTLTIVVASQTNFSSSSGGVMGLRVYNESGTAVAETSNSYAAGTKTLDISGVSGNCRVGLLIWSANTRTLTLSISSAKITK